MNYYNQIKEELINNEVYKKVKDYSKNRSDLNTYYNVGKLLSLAGKHYGEGIIKQYSKKLTIEIGKGYSERNLRNMRQFYNIMSEMNLAVNACQISWTHLVELLWMKDFNKISYYIKISNEQNLSYRKLREKIKNKEYERLSDKTKNKLTLKQKNEVNDFIKNPILIKNSYNYTKITEKILKQLIVEDLNNFLMELGEGFCFIRDEYKIKIGDRYNYIDLLLFNYKHNCFVVVELKVTELKKEHIGQIETYINYVDKHIKTITQNKTIGIIVCAKDNKIILEYCSDPRIYETSFILS